MTQHALTTSGAIGPYLGVLGGMGPMATTDFLVKLIEVTPAANDQDHIPVIVRSVPQIPDRSASIMQLGPSPLTALIQGMRELCASGATRIAIPCNTAHFWYTDLTAVSPVPIFHIADTVADELADYAGSRKVGLLATSGTIKAGIYQERLLSQGHDVVLPTDGEIHDLVMPGIVAVKSGDRGNGRILLERAANALRARGAQEIILACTEIPLALQDTDAQQDVRLIDPTVTLARACADWWLSCNNRISGVNSRPVNEPRAEEGQAIGSGATNRMSARTCPEDQNIEGVMT